MTAAIRWPRRRFDRLTRRQLERQTEHLRDQVNRALAARRAYAQWVASWLEQRADAHAADARHTGTPADRRIAHEMAAADLRQLAIDVERCPNG